MTVNGRIDLQYPDGRSESYRLGEDAITMGSAADNTIQALNAGMAPRHLRIQLSADAFFLTNLAPDHRTTIDDAPAPVDEPTPLPDVARIRAGELSIVFYRSSDNPTVAMNRISDATQPAGFEFRAELDSNSVRVWQYSSASQTLKVTNTTDEAALFRVDTAGLPAEWTSPDSLTFSVDGKDAIDLLFQVKPTPARELPPGEYPLVITIRRLDGRAGALQLVLLIHLGAVCGLSAALDPPSQRAGSPFNLRLHNLGNDDLSLRLRPRQDDRELQIKLARQALVLGPGESASVGGIAERRRPILGKRTNLSFALLAEADEPNNFVVALPANITLTPLVEWRKLVTAALATAIAILALAALLYQPPQPAIASFSSSEPIVAQGAQVQLTWSAEQALSYVIEVNRAPIAELPRAATSFTLDTSGYADAINIALIALNGTANDISSLRLEVYQPATVIVFEADKSALLRALPSELTINWRVEGAVVLDIALPEPFETLRETIAGDEGEIVIAGAADADFQITLTIDDEIGNRTTRALPITIRDPECTPIRDTLLYTGPDSRFERASYAVQNVSVLANGVNPAADWLQVELASGERGWGLLGNFRCHGFNPAKLKVISAIPPPPNPTTAASAISSTSLSPARE